MILLFTFSPFFASKKTFSPFQNTVELSKMIGALDGNENIMIEV